MIRPFSLLPAAVATLSLIGVGSAGVTNASPEEGGASRSCSWVLTPPQVVQVSDRQMVLATVKPGACTLNAQPNESVVCLSMEGGSSQGDCIHMPGTNPASAYYPYRPGATYVVTGQGCADVFENPDNHLATGPTTKLCQSIGPSSFVL